MSKCAMPSCINQMFATFPKILRLPRNSIPYGIPYVYGMPAARDTPYSYAIPDTRTGYPVRVIPYAYCQWCWRDVFGVEPKTVEWNVYWTATTWSFPTWVWYCNLLYRTQYCTVESMYVNTQTTYWRIHSDCEITPPVSRRPIAGAPQSLVSNLFATKAKASFNGRRDGRRADGSTGGPYWIHTCESTERIDGCTTPGARLSDLYVNTTVHKY